MKLVLVLPLYVTIGKKKHYLNLNAYRNWHHFLSNNIKKEFKKIVKSSLYFGKLNNPSFTYQLYYPDNRKRDKMNIIAIIDKFLLDALVELGCMEDDNDEFTDQVIINNPIYNKGNASCVVTIQNN